MVLQFTEHKEHWCLMFFELWVCQEIVIIIPKQKYSARNSADALQLYIKLYE